MIPIEKDIPLPAKIRGRNRQYPWEHMAIGDSFFVAGVKIPSMSQARRSGERRTGFAFASKALDGGVRVWRIA